MWYNNLIKDLPGKRSPQEHGTLLVDSVIDKQNPVENKLPGFPLKIK
jgi:hypothetical protein